MGDTERGPEGHRLGQGILQSVHAYSTGGVYVNFMTAEETDRIQAAYKPAVWKRLVEAKNKWDPKNLFHMNQNIKPSV